MIEEQGINALFLALGHLQWFEADHSKEKRLAPLILVPVLLERTERGSFKLKWDGTDIGSNLSLGALLKEEFGIELPLAEGDDIDVGAYFLKVEGCIDNQQGWSIDRTAITLAFFSFAKYLIYKDLATSSWPPERLILSHAILDALLGSGFPEIENSLPEDTFLDNYRPVGETSEVFDADGSQTLAILQALKGHSMVIEGPPGTGKSQTIANLISEFVAQGKKVLFVSEKSAALNVVYGRLKGAGLTGACLELHGTKANKRLFYQHLRDTMEQAAPRLVDSESLLKRLGLQRQNLNQYVHDLHLPLARRGLSPREAIGRLVQLGTEPDTDGRFDTKFMSGWSYHEFELGKQAVEALQIQLQRIGNPLDHPFFGSERTYISPDDKADLARTIARTKAAFDVFENAATSLTARLNLEVPNSMDGVENLEQVVTFVLNSPDSSGLDFNHDALKNGAPKVVDAVKLGKSVEGLRQKHGTTVADNGWLADVAEIQDLLIAPGSINIPHDSAATWNALDLAENSVHELVQVASKITQTLSVKMPSSLWSMEPLAALAMRIAAAPDCRGLQIEAGYWHTESKGIVEYLEGMRRATDLRKSLEGTVRPDAWTIPVSNIVEILERDGKSVFRRLFGAEFKESRRKAESLLNSPRPSLRDLIWAVSAIQETLEAEARVAKHSQYLPIIFGERLCGSETRFDELLNCARFLGGIHADIESRRIPDEILNGLYQPSTLDSLRSLAEELRQAATQSAGSLDRLQACLEEIQPGHSVALSGDSKERLFKFINESVSIARRKAEALFTPSGRGANWALVVERLTACHEVRITEATVRSLEPLIHGCLGTRWTERAGKWEAIENLVCWASDFISKVDSGALPRGLVSFFQQQLPKDGLRQELEDFRVIRSAYAGCIDSVSQKAMLSGGSSMFVCQSLDLQKRRILKWTANVDELESFYRYNALANRCAELGITQAAELALSMPGASIRLAPEFERAWYNLVVEEAMSERPVLREFDGRSHEDVIGSFRNLDRILITQNRVRVAASHWRSVPRNSAVGEVGFLRLQMNRQRGHRPIRTAMREAPSAVQAIKPVFLMSPMSVAMYLPPEGPLFDVVLFDEASQIKPEDALGSVIRAKQIIVVGDSKQMPPTSFFDRITAAEELEEEDFEDIQSTDIADQESILAFASFRIPEGSPCRRDLRWHYRSRHEDLIKTSNRLFYRDRLVIFPHPQRSGGDAGLVLRHLPATVYGRGNTRKNEAEARAVAEAALEHVRSNPDLSLGLVAFSKAQQEAIADQIDLLLKQDPALAEFDRRHAPDDLFIKNLESVQGDERDVIFISVGYGRDENGFLAMSFGPLTRDGGERRLNVLITRARIRTVVFCNFRASEMRMAEARSAGVKSFHTFLAFAESGHLDVMATILPQEPSYFEECVFENLRNRGYEVDKQVGSEGFYIDLAVRHPHEPGRYVLGIECDGAMYHSAKSARDRDRLRQQVLEDRGWKIHRIWSTDWWRHPDRELNRCCAVIEASVSNQQNTDAAVTVTPGIDVDFSVSHELTELAGAQSHGTIQDATGQNDQPLYVSAKLRWPYGYEIIEMPPWQLATFIKQIVEVEAPVHVDEIVTRIREAAGKGRAGRLIREHVYTSILAAGRQGVLEIRDGFAYGPGQTEFIARNRSSLASQVKRIDYIAPEEIIQAATDILSEAVAVETDQLSRPVSNRLGFERVTVEMSEHINAVLEKAVTSKQLALISGKYHLP